MRVLGLGFPVLGLGCRVKGVCGIMGCVRIKGVAILL